jgi:lipoprotein-anchoring transpeptidase ErfK/SrfK
MMGELRTDPDLSLDPDSTADAGASSSDTDVLPPGQGSSDADATPTHGDAASGDGGEPTSGDGGTSGGRRRRRIGVWGFLGLAFLALLLVAGGAAGYLHWRGDLVPLAKSVYYKLDPPPAATVTASPAPGAAEVRLDATVRVESSGGVLTDVEVRGADGTPLVGATAAGGTVWESAAPLEPSTRYQVRWVAENVAHAETRGSATFTTLTPAETLEMEILPAEGQVYGVGEPLVVRFSHPVEDKAKVEAALEVTNSRGGEGAWRWFSDEEVRYRPAEYWPAHSTVAIDADVRGIEAADGVWGVAGQDVSIDIGRRQVSTVNLDTHQMEVEVDGQVVRSMPMSAGRPGFETRTGVHRIMTQERTHLMDSATIGMPGEYRLTVEYALRLTYSGEFVHAAPWSVGAQGNANVSHGCINLSMEDAAWFFERSQLGDVVDVVGSAGKDPDETEGMREWNMSFEEWKQGSALHGTAGLGEVASGEMGGGARAGEAGAS